MQSPLSDAVREVMQDPEMQRKYPQGLNAVDVLTEIRAREPGAFPLCTVIDVADELQSIYGTRTS